jgi:hypothetical protein
MLMSDITKTIDKIKKDIIHINECEDVDMFIGDNFIQFLNRGEYDDNSIQLGIKYEFLKEIDSDPRFFQKLDFVLKNYVRYLKIPINQTKENVSWQKQS